MSLKTKKFIPWEDTSLSLTPAQVRDKCFESEKKGERIQRHTAVSSQRHKDKEGQALRIELIEEEKQPVLVRLSEEAPKSAQDQVVNGPTHHQLRTKGLLLHKETG